VQYHSDSIESLSVAERRMKTQYGGIFAQGKNCEATRDSCC
jgi:hypothetical protein